MTKDLRYDGPDNLTELQAYAVEGQLRCYCPRCRKWHVHGAGLGHRVAHCHNEPPDGFLGYILVGGEPPPADVLKAIKRNRPIAQI